MSNISFLCPRTLKKRPEFRLAWCHPSGQSLAPAAEVFVCFLVFSETALFIGSLPVGAFVADGVYLDILSLWGHMIIRRHAKTRRAPFDLAVSDTQMLAVKGGPLWTTRNHIAFEDTAQPKL